MSVVPPLYIGEEQVEAALQARPLTDELERCFLDLSRGEASNQPRSRAVLGRHVVHTLPAISRRLGRAACKTYLSGPGGVRFLTLLFDLESSALLATVESHRLGQLRTGCATALAVRHLLPEGPVQLALLGSGTVAHGQLEAIAAELGDRLHAIRCCSRRNGEKLATWARQRLDLEVSVTDNVPDSVRGANLVVCATSALTPILEGDSLGDSGLLCAVGANWAQKREVDAGAVHRCSRWWVDDRQQARLEAGDLLLVPDFDWENLSTLAELVSQPPGSGPGWRGFKSLGLGLEDLAAASLVYDSVTSA